MNISSTIIRNVTNDYIASIDKANPPSPSQMEQELLEQFKIAVTAENAILDKNERMHIISELPSITIAKLLVETQSVVLLAKAPNATRRECILACYNSDASSPNYGIYESEEMILRALIRKFQEELPEKKFKEIFLGLQEIAPIRIINQNKDLIALANGIFYYKSKMLVPFSPDYIFDAKSPVKFNPNAQNVVIHNVEDGSDWDVDSWVQELSDDPEVVHLLWQILGAIVRPYVPWNKAIFLFANSGNNGKGCLIQLLESLIGNGRYLSSSFEELEDRFALSSLVSGQIAILSDESSVGTYIESSKRFKSLVQGDSIYVDRKNRDAVQLVFRGLMVFSFNMLPRVRDTTGSFQHRYIVVPFDKCFTGEERKYIKSDYLKRQEVLEYIIFKTLNIMDTYYEFDEPERCQRYKHNYAVSNDFVFEFLQEVLPQLTWNYVPKIFLYELFVAYSKVHNPSLRVEKESMFWAKVIPIIKDSFSDEWNTHDSNYPSKAYGFPDEPLIVEYNMYGWMANPNNPTGAVNLGKIKTSMMAITRVVPSKPFS